MLLGPAALRRRLPLIIAFVLAGLLVAAGLAALQTPTFRSTATVSGPTDLATIVRSGEVAQNFRTRVAAAYGDEVAATAVAFASESGPRIELATESQFAGTAEDLTRFYAEAVLATRPDVVIEEPASFPMSAHSPNLRRLALVGFVIGASLGLVVAALIERRTDAVPPALSKAPSLAISPGTSAVPTSLSEAPGNSAVPTSLSEAPGTSSVPATPSEAPGTSRVPTSLSEAPGTSRVPTTPSEAPGTSSVPVTPSEAPGTSSVPTTHAPRISEVNRPATKPQGLAPPRPKTASEVPRVVQLPDPQ